MVLTTREMVRLFRSDCIVPADLEGGRLHHPRRRAAHPRRGGEMAASRGSQLWKPDASAGIRFSHDTVNAVEKKYEHLFSRRTDGPPTRMCFL